MLITLILDASRLWHWHLTLIDQLAAYPGARVAVAFAPERRPHRQALALALQLEQAISHRAAAHPFDPINPGDLRAWTGPAGDAGDVTIDLAACAVASAQPQRSLVPLFDGLPGESAFWSALLDGTAPHLAVFDSARGITAIGQPGIESPHALRKSAAAVATRLITGLVRAIKTPAHASERANEPAMEPRSPSLAAPAAHLLARKVANKAQRLIDRTLATAPQWAVAWRTLPSNHDLLSAGELDPASFRHLSDDGARYYADPFLFAHGPQTHLFVEELPYATNRGIISVSTLQADGSFSTPQPVLETPFHLSYPHVFARDGAIWMLPEQTASGGLTLYRAIRYPDRWEPVAQLIGEPLHDATLFEHGGLLWIAANTEGPACARWGSSWDALSLYSSKTLLGPWTPHPGNPLLIDAEQTRSAGEVFGVGAKRYRPVQDCSSGYGVALGIAEITALDRETFAQSIVSRLSFKPRSGIAGPHTLNRLQSGANLIETIDLFAPSKTIRAIR